MNDASAYLTRSQQLLGSDGIKRLKNATVAVFGIGGVGSYAAEALARSGVGTLHFIDRDVVCFSNINRQIIADSQSIGSYKADLMKERTLLINPTAVVFSHPMDFSEDTVDCFDFKSFDFIIDAIDQVSAKILLITKAREWGVPIISSMGTGNKLDPLKFEVCDIYKTSVCPLARIMRRELKARGIPSLQVVYSREKPIVSKAGETSGVIGSVAFVPSVAGLILAGEVVKQIALDLNSIR